MIDESLLKMIYEISEDFHVILRGHIVINKDTNVIIFAHECSSELFYKHFFKISRETFHANKLAKRNLAIVKHILKKAGYKKIWTKDAFSFYGDLRPLAVEAKFGKWGNNGLVYNENYKNDFLISAIFFK